MTVELTKSEIKGAIAGMLLGDGYLDKNLPRIEISCTERHLEYLKLKNSVLDNITGIVYNIQLKDKVINGVKYSYYRSFTRKNNYFEQFRWIKNGEVNRKNLSALSEFGFALWCFDDGSLEVSVKKNTGYVRHRQFELYCLRYSITEIIEIRQFIQDRFGINFNIKELKSRKTPYRFYLKTASTIELQKLLIILHKYAPACMRYKLNLKHHLGKMTLLPEYEKLLKRLPPDYFQGEDVLQNG